MPLGSDEGAHPSLMVPALAVAAVLLALTAVLIALTAHQTGPVSHDPTLRTGTGYGTFEGDTGGDIIFGLRCLDNPSGVAEPGGFFQVPVSHLTFVVAPPAGDRPATAVPEYVFLADTRLHHFRGYVVMRDGQGTVTDAPGATGCAGTVGPHGVLSPAHAPATHAT